MALVLNEEQVLLRDSAAGFLAEKATVAHQRALRDGDNDRGFNDDVWREMAQMGWAGIAIAEQYGGLGYGYTGLGLVLEQAGRNLTASPLQATVLVAATVIAELGSEQQKEQLLSAIASGEQLITLALQEGPHHAPLQCSVEARLEGEHYVLNGRKVLVLDALSAKRFIVIARTAGEPGQEQGLTAFLVEADSRGLSVERRSLVDSRAVGAITLDTVKVPAGNLLGQPGEAALGLNRALDIANIGLAAELLGVSVEAFERTVGYIKERKQFGRVIGSFQGLAHRAAELYAELELARSIVLQALQKIDAGEQDLSLPASAAKAKLCEVAQRATNEAIQMHGGIGMTDEHEIGFFIKRARVAQHTLGDYNYHLDRFARLSGF
ncbi:MAG: acyl-CoA dehydrogenase family protein [Halioglobus sp.]|nr:acyl-CoA dehydrogenase family protein [Halioglobus sp.]